MHGRFDQVTAYDEDPQARLAAFAAAGAAWVHIVDLDGAEQGRAVQHALIGQLAASGLAQIQSGGTPPGYPAHGRQSYFAGFQPDKAVRIVSANHPEELARAGRGADGRTCKTGRRSERPRGRRPSQENRHGCFG
jgi:hypothetical protein